MDTPGDERLERYAARLEQSRDTRMWVIFQEARIPLSTIASSSQS
jgi:hypothetical protein